MSGANQSISAGIGGFLAFFLLALVLWLLMRNMNTRLQNLKYNEEAGEARRQAERAAAVSSRPPSAHASGPPDSAGPGLATGPDGLGSRGGAAAGGSGSMVAPEGPASS